MGGEKKIIVAYGRGPTRAERKKAYGPRLRACKRNGAYGPCLRAEKVPNGESKARGVVLTGEEMVAEGAPRPVRGRTAVSCHGR
jgi:hypothetical protein